MTVRFKGNSEYRSKYKGRSRSDSPHLRMRLAGLRSDQTSITREPQFLSKRKVPFNPPQVSRSLRWEVCDPSQPVPSPAVRGRSEERQVTPKAPRDSTPQGGTTAPSQIQAEAHRAQPTFTTEDQPKPNGVNHALRKKAGLRSGRQRNGRLISEYQRQFMLRKVPVQESPLLAAHEMFYNDSKAIPPFKSNPVIMESEYRRNFKGSPPPRPPRLRRDGEQHEISQFLTERNKRKKKKKRNERKFSRKSSPKEEVSHAQTEFQQEVMSPRAPRNPSPQTNRKVKSEYRSSFRSPLQYRYRDGVWVKTRTAQVEERERNECWFNEVQELREKAEAYRKRAWGTHFSRHHLNQIISEQNWMWEPSSGTSSSSSVVSGCCRPNSSPVIEALDLARASSDRRSSSPGPSASAAANRRSSAEEVVLPQGSTLPVRRKLAWDEEAGPQERNEVNVSREELTGEKNEETFKNGHEEPKEDRNIQEKNKGLQVLETDSSVVEGSGGGRLPTPKLKTMQTAQRTHHDRTTPATGGALLVSPPKIKRSSSRVRRNQPPLGKPHSPYRHEAEIRSSQLSSPAAGLTTVDPLPMREDTGSEVEPDCSNPTQAKPSPTLERQHPKTSVPPLARIQGTMRNPEFQHNGNLGILRPDLFPESDSGVSDNDDKMSQLSSRSAASCSMASEILDRAERRKREFWGKI